MLIYSMAGFCFHMRFAYLALCALFFTFILLGCVSEEKKPTFSTNITESGQGQNITNVTNETAAANETAGANETGEEAVNETVPEEETPGPVKPRPVPTDPNRGPDNIFLFFFDVGFGDSVFVKYGSFEMLIDGGPNETAENVTAWMRQIGVSGPIDVVVSTHARPQNYDGLHAVLDEFSIGEFWWNGVNTTDARYKELLEKAAGKAKRVRIVERGYNYTQTEFTATVLNPSKRRFLSNPDTDSIVTKLSFRNFCAMLMADTTGGPASGKEGGGFSEGEIGIEGSLVAAGYDMRCDLLMVGAHGSGVAASGQFINAVRPIAAIISVGPNDMRLPEITTIRRLRMQNVSVFRTDQYGSITIKSDGINSIGTNLELYTPRADTGG
jgi:beta-lactamase superfamily II metal-dependent hydrolase